MTARTDYLTTLTIAGFTPTRALTFEEGSSIPQDFYGLAGETIGGTPVWGTNATYGPFWQADSTNDNATLPNNPDWAGTTKQTVLFIIRKTDTTLRQHSVFAVNTAASGDRLNVHLPWSDGNIYWDFGGAAAPNRLSVAITKDTTITAWALHAGPAGMAIWKNGVSVANTATANPGRSSSTNPVSLNAAFSINGDLQEYYFIAFIPDQVSDAVLAGFTVDNVLIGAPLPSITTTSPLPDATKNVPYTKIFAAMSGTPPYTWAVVSGAPAGLTMAASTGVLSGTPTVAGISHIIISVTDALNHSSQQTFDLYTDDPLCTPLAFGSLTRGVFSNNSRVGPHQDEGHKIALIFRDADNPKKLTAQYATNNGVSWTAVSTAALVNNIASHDSHKVGSTIHVWTQESTTGRVAYFTFDLVTGVWTLENQQVQASETIVDGCVSGTVLSPSGDAALVYESSFEHATPTHLRMTYKRRTGGVWSSALPLGNVTLNKGDSFGRLIAGNADQSTIFFRMDDGSATPNFQMQRIYADNTKSPVIEWRSTGLLGTSPNFWAGDYGTYGSGSGLTIVFPCKFGGEPTIFSFLDALLPASPAQSEAVLGDFVGEGPFAPIVARYVGGALHLLDFAWPSLSGESFICHKTAASASGPFTPSGSMTDQTGPTMGAITGNLQTMDGNFVVRTCQGVDSLYVATVAPIGTVDTITNTVKFEWLKVDDLPSSSSLTLSQWLTDLETQTIEFCCSDTPPLGATTCECETHNGRIYRMAMDLYTDDGCTIRRLRRTPHISEEQARMIHHLLQVDVETGKGLVTGQGNDPQVMLRFSDDGGITWSNERWESAGKLGEFRQRVMFRRLGQSRDRLYELVVTDPVKWAIVSGYLDISAGFK